MGPIFRGAIIGGVAELAIRGIVGMMSGGLVLILPLAFGLYCLSAFHEWATGAKEQQAPVFERKANNTRQVKMAFNEQKAMITSGAVEAVWPSPRLGFMAGMNIEIRNDSEMTVHGGRAYCQYDVVEVWKKNYSTYNERFQTPKINMEIEPGQHRVVYFPTPSDRIPDTSQKLAGPITCNFEPVVDYEAFEGSFNRYK